MTERTSSPGRDLAVDKREVSAVCLPERAQVVVGRPGSITSPPPPAHAVPQDF
jgi:hypothetical protein